MSEPRAPAVQGFHAWDLVLVFALTAIALVGWSSTYRGAGWFVAGGLAALAGAVIAFVVVSLRGGVEIVSLLLLVVYYLVSGPIVDGSLRLDGLRTLENGIRANVEGWPILLGTHPPVDAEGAVLLAPVLLCLVSAGMGAATALRGTRVAWPLVPPTMMLGSVLLLAQPEPVSVLLQGVGYGALAMLWMRLRGLRVDETAHGRDPARLWRLGGSVVIVVVTALVAGVLADTTEPGERLLLSRSLAAYDVGAVRTPLDGFRDYTRQRDKPSGNVFDVRLFEVEGAPAGTRVRLAALDTYDGSRWKASNDTDPSRHDDRFLMLSSTITNPARGREVAVTITPSARYTLPWVPMVGALQSFEFLGRARKDARTHLRYNPATQTGVMDDRLEENDSYRFTTRLTGGLLKPRMEPSGLWDQAVYDAGAFLQPAVNTWSAGAYGQVDALMRVAARLKKEGRYSDGYADWESVYLPGHSESRLGDDFLFEVPSVGNDEQYAAVIALMATRLGFPARVVVGAVVPESGVVRGRDVEAWVEVRISDGSWRTLPTESFMGRRPPKREDSRGGSTGVRHFPPPIPEQQPPAQPEQQPQPDPPQEEEEPDEESDSGGGVPWRLVLLLLLGGLLVAVPLAKAVRQRRRLGARRVTARYAGAWAELIDRARDLGTPVPDGLTRPAEARALGARLAEVGEGEQGSVLTLAQEADARIFGADEPAPADAAAFWDLVRDQRSGLAADVPLRRRLWAVFNPASLRRPRPPGGL
ncbi:transglutaminase [Nocardioides szechwanensis]|uniref:Transglutaminase-like superfamily protein n=1 Tax=Nocardioides szechwanensis TaxID=1005944 RepID=A0A1H0DJA8_9ACTN|nr:transglutaminase-like domain-containing protein [Nocardioides szechwanensis]GEP35162.1 transglutaminase [Nocardioides szechwanensis]SDN70204.1 Transglutaminase-like superfamily protein [Nocardioides szechwanensis]